MSLGFLEWNTPKSDRVARLDMFKEERLIPVIALLTFVYGVVGLVWGTQLGIVEFVSSLPRFALVGFLFIAYALKLRVAGGESKGRVSWWAIILGAATQVILSYAGFAQRGNEEQQAGLFYFFLILLIIILSQLDVLRRRSEEELTA